MSTELLKRPEGRIAYDVTGAGPLVVCAPGMGELRSIYAATVTGIVGAGYRVATMDLRGHGESDTTFGAADDVALASDLRALIEELGGPAVVVGSSMGAGAAVILAADAPELVAGLVLAGPFVRNPQPAGPAATLAGAAMWAMLRRPWGPSIWAGYHASLFPGERSAWVTEHLAEVRASIRRSSQWRAFQRTAQTTHEPAEARLAGVRCPVLVVMGTADRDWKDPAAEGRWVAEALHGELLLVEGAGHYPLAQRPDLTEAPLRGALARMTTHA